MRRRDDDDEDEDYRPRRRQRRHSGLGIASFVIALGVVLLELVMVISAGVLQASRPGGVDENSPEAALIGLSICFGLMLDMVGIGLGIGGLLQPKRNKLFAVLGITLGGLVFLGVICLIVLGLAMG